MVSEYVTIVTLVVAISGSSNYSYVVGVIIVYCGLLFLKRLSTMPNDINSCENKSAMVIAYGMAASCGLLWGLVLGWFIWGQCQ